MDLIGVMIGGALGGVARLWLAAWIGRMAGERFPWGTLAVNVSGAFVIGLAAATASAGGWLADLTAWRLAVVGFLGSYTTVSAFSLQCLLMLRAGERGCALALMGMSVVFCIGAAAIGLVAGAGLAGVSG